MKGEILMINKNYEQDSECTTIIVGKDMMEDNSIIAARTADSNAMRSRRFEIYQDTEDGPTEFIALDSPFKCNDLPKKRYGYTALPPYDLPGHWGSAGFNSQGVGMSATETIFSSEAAEKADPMVEDGVGENCIFNIVLPYIKTAREGVIRTGELIEKYGVSLGFGNSYVDKDEVWYLETAAGHGWMATRIPKDVYFVSGNQARLRKYDPNDSENYLGSKNLIEFAEKNGLYDPSKGEFDFQEAYGREIELDTRYNYPRVWGLQKLYSPSIENDVTKNSFPVFAKAEKKLSLNDIKEGLRFHYNGTEHDPYFNNNPHEKYRPVSIFRITQAHILQVREDLPKEIGEICYVSIGMTSLGVFLPYYQGMSEYLPSYNIGDNNYSEDSAYWNFRKVQTLVMLNYNRYAPIVQKAYKEFEEEIADRQKAMEKKYLEIYQNDSKAAKDLIQEFSTKMMENALELTNQLHDKLFTMITENIQATYLFRGA